VIVTRRILLVIKNNNAIREVTQLCLEVTARWHVLTASSSSDCIVKAVTEQVDAILVNIDTDFTDNEENIIFQQLRDNPATQNIPIVLLTNSDQYKIPQMAQARINAIITKPFDLLLLAYRVAAVLGWEL
jgi:CheY-like chemotaxis protein